jgi:hypothetical protein
LQQLADAGDEATGERFRRLPAGRPHVRCQATRSASAPTRASHENRLRVGLVSMSPA